jgi:FkbM family methyltransferase
MLAHGQNLEDVLIWRALKHIENGFYIDIGAQHPTVDSVSRSFYLAGWRGVHVEPSPTYAALLRSERPEETVIEAAISNSDEAITFFEFPGTGVSTGVQEIAEQLKVGGHAQREITVRSLTLAQLFEQFPDREIHWLKIDVEGMESNVLASWGDSAVRPWILVVESVIGSCGTDTADSWRDEITSRNYFEVFFDGLNRYFVSSEHRYLAQSFGAPPNVFDNFSLAPSHSWCAPAMHHLHIERTELETTRVNAQKQHEEAEATVSSLRHERDQAQHEILVVKRQADEQKALSEATSERMGEQIEALSEAYALSEQKIREIEHSLDALANNRLKRLRFAFVSAAKARGLMPLVQASGSDEINTATPSQSAPNVPQPVENDSKMPNRPPFRAPNFEHLWSLDGAQFIECAYTTVLKRPPDRDGMLTHLGFLDQGWSKMSILRGLRRSAEGAMREEPFAGFDQALEIYRRERFLMEKLLVGNGIRRLFSKRYAGGFARLPFRMVEDVKAGPYVHTVDELLQLHDLDFIDQAYACVLGRPADEKGRAHYVNRLRTGGDRRSVLADLFRSREARGPHPQLPGLVHAVRSFDRSRKLQRLIGWCTPSQNQDLRALVNQLGRLEARIEGRINNLEENIQDFSNRIQTINTESTTKTARLGASRQLRLSNNVRNPSTPPPRIIYYFVDHTIGCEINTGMQRLVRQLGKKLKDVEETVLFVKWDPEIKKLILVSRGDLDHLAKWNGPVLSPEEWNWYPAEVGAEVEMPAIEAETWLVVPEVTHITHHAAPVTLDIIMAARSMGMLIGFVYYDAIPVRLPEYASASEQHERYMQTLLLADLILPISQRSADEIEQYFIEYQQARSQLPRIIATPLPGESALAPRESEARPGLGEKIILSVGSIEPRKNQLALVEAFERFAATPEGREWRLILAGHLRGDVAERLNAAMKRQGRIQYKAHPSDDELDELYRRATLTVFPSVEEGFGLPILESLWYGVPCICANFGAMAEVAAGGGCITVDTRDFTKIADALSLLAADPQKLGALSRQAVDRKMPGWGSYAETVRASLNSVALRSTTLPPIYFWANDTQHNPHNSGIQRVTRQLASAMIKLGQPLIATGWDGTKFIPVTKDGLDHLAKWNGPATDGWSEWVDPAEADQPEWIIVPELVHGAMGAIHDYAASVGIRSAAIFYDTIPYKMTDIFSAEFSANHGKYMRDLSKFDKVFSISEFSHDELKRFLLGERIQTHSFDHRFEAIAQLGPMTERPRATQIKETAGDPVRLLAVISIEPRKNALRLLQAFTEAIKLSERRLQLTVVGRRIPMFEALADDILQYEQQLNSFEWREDIDDAALAALYAQADFSVFPSLEEGYGLPIVESLWHARPCIVHHNGAMAETAAGGGCYAVDMEDVSSLSNAISALANDDRLRNRLAQEAISRPLPSWSGYAETILDRLAADRLSETQLAVEPRNWTRPIEEELPNLKKRPRLSVCISTYNRGPWLAVNLRNLFTLYPEPLADVEFLVVDNCSSDNTEEVVSPYLDRPDFRFKRNAVNVGMLGNLTVTAHEALGEYIWILGDDDLLKAGCIEKVIEVIKGHPGIGLIYPNYAYTHEADPNEVGTDIQSFLEKCPILTPAGPDQYAKVKDIAANNENLFTAIYCLIFRRDHALRAYSLDTSGRPFSTMRTSIPTTYYVLNYMMEESAYWMGDLLLVVNFNVSWNKYASLQILERVPEAQDLAQRLGANRKGMDLWRVNLMPGVAHFWREIFENDVEENARYFKPERVVMRLKHLPEFAEIAPQLIETYKRAREHKHSAAQLPTASLFGAFVQEDLNI